MRQCPYRLSIHRQSLCISTNDVKADTG
ncbi:hypothetical protein BN10_760030 [Phycicoccus elongatus Lp2]|uniref:Uncharacterized protein n=1 Tax=Phycicoccus elongatus Lp2 TaxID=1193181 RepID=N0E2D9_9MICO|nr:hypothetical protein BN10_760030 [Phycicoccus elongatus Lp2]